MQQNKSFIGNLILFVSLLLVSDILYLLYDMGGKNVVFLVLMFIFLNVSAGFLIFLFKKYGLPKFPKLSFRLNIDIIWAVLVSVGLTVIIMTGFSLFHNAFYLLSAILLLCGMILFALYSSNKFEKDSYSLTRNQSGMISAGGYFRLLAFLVSLILLWYCIVLFKAESIKSGVIYFTVAAILAVSFFKLHENEYAPQAGEAAKWKYYDLFLALGIGVIAFVIRSAYLADLPGGLADDEYLTMHFSNNVFKGVKYQAYMSDPVANQASLIFYIIAIFYKIFGFGIAASRMAAVTASSLSVVLIYYVAKRFFNRRVAVLASLFMAFMFVDILYARINIAFSTVILFATLCIFLFFKGEEDGKKRWYILSGISFGLTLYFYNAAKLLPVVFVLYFIYRVLVSKDSREALFKKKFSYAIFFASAIIAFLPIIAFIIKNPELYFIRLRQTSHFASLDFLKNLNYSFLAIFNGAVSYFQMLIAKGGLSGQWNITMKQYFDGLTAFFFIVGLAYLVSDFKNRKKSFLLIWFIAGMAGGILSITAEGSTGHRATLAFPCFGIFAAIGLDKCLNILRYINNDRVVKVAKVLVISVVLFFVAYINLNNYFYVYSNDAAMRLERKPYYGQIAKTMALYNIKMAHVSNYYKWGMTSSIFDTELADKKIQNTGVNILDLGFDQIQNTKEGYFAAVGEGLYNRVFDLYREYYPEAVVKKAWNYDYLLFDNKSTYRKLMGWNKPEEVIRFLQVRWENSTVDKWAQYLNYVFCYIPKDAVDKTASVQAQFFKAGALVQTLPNCAIPVENQAGADVVKIKSLLYVPAYGKYDIVVKDVLGADVFLDNNKILGSALLYRGLHRISVDMRIAPGKNPVIMWKKPFDKMAMPVGKEYFVNSDKIFGLMGNYYDKNSLVYSQLEAQPLKRFVYFDKEAPFQHNPDINRFIWTGPIHVRESGDYLFLLENLVTDSDVVVDGKKVFSKIGDKSTQAPLYLSKGRHTINITVAVNGNLLDSQPVRLKMKREKQDIYWVPDYTYFER